MSANGHTSFGLGGPRIGRTYLASSCSLSSSESSSLSSSLDLSSSSSSSSSLSVSSRLLPFPSSSLHAPTAFDLPPIAIGLAVLPPPPCDIGVSEKADILSAVGVVVPERGACVWPGMVMLSRRWVFSATRGVVVPGEGYLSEFDRDGGAERGGGGEVVMI